jgi:hypothetical protein
LFWAKAVVAARQRMTVGRDEALRECIGSGKESFEELHRRVLREELDDRKAS